MFSPDGGLGMWLNLPFYNGLANCGHNYTSDCFCVATLLHLFGLGGWQMYFFVLTQDSCLPVLFIDRHKAHLIFIFYIPLERRNVFRARLPLFEVRMASTRLFTFRAHFILPNISELRIFSVLLSQLTVRAWVRQLSILPFAKLGSKLRSRSAVWALMGFLNRSTFLALSGRVW